MNIADNVGELDGIGKKSFLYELIRDISVIDYYINMDKYEPKEVFHYCTFQTLLSIIENETLRFSNIAFLNDTTEFMEAIKVYRNILERKKEYINKDLFEILNSDNVYKQLEDYKQAYNINYIDSNQKINNQKCKVFLCSFSINNDSLQLWQNYGSNFSGCNVCFAEPTTLLEIPENIEVFCRKIVYIQNEKEKCIGALINDLIKWSKPITQVNDYKEYLENAVIHAINSMRIFFKHEGFIGEQEYRIALLIPEEALKKKIGKHKLEFFSRGNILVPYIDCNFKKNNMEGVVLGPFVGQDTSERGVRELLDHFNYNNYQIGKSAIPLLNDKN